MAKVQTYYSLEREALPLCEWLLKLVGDDRATREAAGKALSRSLDRHLADVDFSPNPVERGASFQNAIREAVAAPGFDTAEFIRRLCAFRVVISDDWQRRVDACFRLEAPVERQWERISERLVTKINASGDAAVRRKVMTRLVRALWAISAREERISKRTGADAEALSISGLMAHLVFGALDTAFLVAPEALQLVLEHPQEAHAALAALERIGPPAIGFAPQLLERIRRAHASGAHCAEEAARALGSIIRGNGAFVDQIRNCLHDPHAEVRNAAAVALARLGTQVAGREVDIVRDLLQLLEQKVDFYLVQALASVGRHIPTARKRVIELTRPRPPVWEPVTGYPDMKFDRMMCERGWAIDAMKYLTEYAEECVPVLVEAIDSFEEFDPDQSYSGPVSRIAFVLQSFGPAAGSAAIFLTEKLTFEDGELPTAILAALAAMGPAARRVLPRLEQFRKQIERDEPLPSLTGSRPDQSVDPVGWTIWTIQGQAK